MHTKIVSNVRKIVFIEHLRVYACLFVITSHLLGSFLYYHESIAKDAYFAPFLLSIPVSPIGFLKNLHINLGSVGVAIFFLITGFVTPLSLENKKSRVFLVIRFFRLYPAYLVSLIIVIGLLLINARINNISISWKFSELLSNVFLITNFTRHKAFDLVIDTLLIQIRFYVAYAIIFFRPEVKTARRFAVFVFLVFLASAGINLLNKQIVDSYVLPGIFSSIRGLTYFLFIFIGTVLYCVYQKKCTKKVAFYTMIGLFSLFIFCLKINLGYAGFIETLTSYIIGLWIFLLFFLRREQTTYSSMMSFIAQLTYSLFLNHRIVGYVLLSLFIKQAHLYYYAALPLTLLIIFFLAFIIYTYVEKPIYLFAKTHIK